MAGHLGWSSVGLVAAGPSDQQLGSKQHGSGFEVWLPWSTQRAEVAGRDWWPGLELPAHWPCAACTGWSGGLDAPLSSGPGPRTAAWWLRCGPFISVTALVASSGDEKQTKPKPLLRPPSIITWVENAIKLVAWQILTIVCTTHVNSAATEFQWWWPTQLLIK